MKLSVTTILSLLFAATTITALDCDRDCKATFPEASNQTFQNRCRLLCRACSKAQNDRFLPLSVDCNKRCGGDRDCVGRCQFYQSTCFPFGPQGGAGCPDQVKVCGIACTQRDPRNLSICTQWSWNI